MKMAIKEWLYDSVSICLSILYDSIDVKMNPVCQ